MRASHPIPSILKAKTVAAKGHYRSLCFLIGTAAFKALPAAS
jgi:hypothetical protein